MRVVSFEKSLQSKVTKTPTILQNFDLIKTVVVLQHNPGGIQSKNSNDQNQDRPLDMDERVYDNHSHPELFS